MRSNIVIGLTGSFGSGCTTVAEVLEKDYGFVKYSLSDEVKSEWARRYKNRGEKPLRRELQDIGNELRYKSRDYAILAKKYIKKFLRIKTEIKI